MRANDGAAAIAKPPAITDLLLNMNRLSYGTLHGTTMEAANGCVKPPAGGFTAL